MPDASQPLGLTDVELKAALRTDEGRNPLDALTAIFEKVDSETVVGSIRAIGDAALSAQTPAEQWEGPASSPFIRKVYEQGSGSRALAKRILEMHDMTDVQEGGEVVERMFGEVETLLRNLLFVLIKSKRAEIGAALGAAPEED